MGLPGVKHAKGHLGHEAGIVVALESETQLLQALCYDLWPGPAADRHAWQHFNVTVGPAQACSRLKNFGKDAQNSPARSLCQLNKQSCKGQPLMIRQLL